MNSDFTRRKPSSCKRLRRSSHKAAIGCIESLETRTLLSAVPFESTIIECCSAADSRSLVSADIDGDGDSDLLFATNDEVGWLEHLGPKKAFTEHIIGPPGDSRSSIRDAVASDVDNDGDVDVITATRN